MGRQLNVQTPALMTLRSQMADAYRKLLREGDFEALEVSMATVLANRVEGDSVSVFLVSPPSSGKTEAVMALKDLSDTYWLSTLTPKTLASGFDPNEGAGPKHPAKKTALLEQLPEHCTLILKEFTSILSLAPNDRREVIGQLRDILDGQYRKVHGNGVAIDWSGSLGILAAVTEKIEEHREAVSTMGDRWLLLALKQPSDRVGIAMAAMENSTDEPHLREALRKPLIQIMNAIGVPNLREVRCTNSTKELIAKSVEFMCTARTPVPRDSNSKELLYVPGPEGPARATKAVFKLLQCLCVVRGRDEITDQELRILRRIVIDNLPFARRAIVNTLLSSRTSLSTSELKNKLGRGWSGIEATLDDLERFGAVTSSVDDSDGRSGRPSTRWGLSDAAKAVFSPGTKVGSISHHSPTSIPGENLPVCPDPKESTSEVLYDWLFLEEAHTG